MKRNDEISQPHHNRATAGDRTVALAEIDRDSLKAFFHIMVGKPDSTIQIYDGGFQLGLTDIANLNEQVSRKIRNHNIETINTSAHLSSSDQTIREFGAIGDLLNHPTSGAEQTNEITLKWDFLVNIATYQMPQRHTLTVKVGRSPDAKETLRRLLSRDNDDMGDPHDLAYAPMYCRADFVSPILGKELLYIVSDWHKGLKRPVGVSPIFLKVRRHRNAISKAIEYTIPLTVGLFCIAIFRFLLSAYPPTDPLTVSLLDKTGIWFAASLAIIYVTTIGSRLLAAASLTNLSSADIHSVLFALTNGDYNANQKSIDRNNTRFRTFLFSAGWAVTLNIVATYLAFRLGIGTNP